MIEQNLYNQILENIPIICVDGVIKHGESVLMLKRNNEPEKGNWWFPGGRVLKGEKLDMAIQRKIKMEIGLDTRIVSQIGITETIFKTGPNNIPVHTINITYLLELINFDIPKLDVDHSEYKWFNIHNIPDKLHPELKRIIKKL